MLAANMMASRKDNPNSSQWALLPHNLLHQITSRLHKPSDYVRFGAVCKGWLSFAHKRFKQKHLLHIHRNNPLLLIPTESQQVRLDLYSVIKDVVYDQLQLQLPYKRCCGSSHGWLFFVEKENESTLELILLNLFLEDNAIIKLPPIKIFHMLDDNEVKKAILSKDPYVSPDDYEVVALYGLGRLAHYKSGDKFWSYVKIEMPILNDDRQRYCSDPVADVIFYKNLIFAVDRHGRIANLTLEPMEPIIQSTNCSPWYLEWNTIGEQLPTQQRSFGNAYLVENSKGDLLLAQRYYTPQAQAQAQAQAQELARPFNLFRVYRLCLPSSGEQVIAKKLRMKTLNGETLFLGGNNSISVRALKYPRLHPNSIYYTDDIHPRNFQIWGIFHLQNASFREHQFVPRCSTIDMPPPIFFVSQKRFNKNFFV